MKLLLSILILSASAYGQALGNVTMALFNGTPTGSCSSRQIALNTTNGALYTCLLGAWVPIAGGGGGGGWNPPNAPGITLFGNNAVSTGPPSFFIPSGDISFGGGTFSVNSLHFGPTALELTNTGIASGNCLTVSGATLIGGPCGTGTGGGTTLDGCHTPTSGNLVCDNSVVGGTGPIGMLSLPYTGTSLPTAPTTASLGALTINSSGVWWTPGNSTAWAQIGTGGGGSGQATSLLFGSAGFPLSASAPVSGECLMVGPSPDNNIVGGACGAGGSGGMGGVTIIE